MYHYPHGFSNLLNQTGGLQQQQSFEFQKQEKKKVEMQFATRFLIVYFTNQLTNISKSNKPLF